MSGRSVAVRYARALYEVADEKHMIGVVTDDLARMTDLMTRARPVRDYCLRPHSDHLAEMRFLETAFLQDVSLLTGELLKTAVRNGRLAALPYLFPAFEQIKDTASGITNVTLESPRPAEETLLKTVTTKMEKQLKRQVRLSNHIVPGLLGGIRILWDNRMVDLSAAGRLKKMRSLIKAD